MKNFIQTGDIVPVIAPANVKSGDLVVVGALFGVAHADAASSEVVEIKTNGVFVLPKTSAQAWALGAAVYWDNTNKVATTTATSNTFIGHAVEGAANPSSAGVVRLSI